ncbi:MAG TPA: FMN-binding glutamate synthase family protein, partial [Parvibaculum sp.]|nr:FMN-binding glutamate synthase family protein [Parvibaculum sp.]
MTSLVARYVVFALCVAITLLTLPFLGMVHWLWIVTLVAGFLSIVGVYDLLQTHHAVRRNYPVIGNIRYLVE